MPLTNEEKTDLIARLAGGDVVMARQALRDAFWHLTRWPFSRTRVDAFFDAFERLQDLNANRAIGNIARPMFPDGIAQTEPGPLSTPYNNWSPFHLGLQLDLVYNGIVAVATGAPTPDCTGLSRAKNGIQIFPGSVPIYRGDKLIGATKRNALIGFIAGGVMFAGGVPMSIFGDPPVDHCANLADAAGDVCGGHITNDSGETYTWTVTKPGTYKVEVLQPNVKIPIIPVLQITDEAGARVLPADTTADEKVESIETAFKAGKYKINVRDAAKGDAAKFKGGFSFKLNIVSTGVAPADSGSGGPAASGAPAVTGTAAKPALTAATPVKPTTPTTTAKPAVTAVAKPPVAKPTPAPVKKK